MKKKLKLNVYVVRKKTNSESKLGESAPCKDCYNKMVEIGVKNIIYSAETKEGIGIIKQRLSDYKPKTISLGRQFIDGGMVPIHRNKAHLRILHDDDDSSESDTTSTCSDTSYQSESSYSSTTSSKPSSKPSSKSKCSKSKCSKSKR